MNSCIVVSPKSDLLELDHAAEIMPCVFAKMRNTLAVASAMADSLKRSVLIVEILPLLGEPVPIYQIMRPGMSAGRILTTIGVPMVPRTIIVRPDHKIQKASMLFPATEYVNAHRQPGSGNIIIH